LDCSIEETKTNDVHLDKEYFKSYLTDTAHLLSSPLRWDKYDWLTASLVIGATAGLYAFDQNIHDWAQNRRGKTTDDIASVVKVFGQGQYTVPALGLFYLYGYAAENSRVNELSAAAEKICSFPNILSERFGKYEPSVESGYKKLDLNRLFQMIIFFAKDGVLKTKLCKLIFYADFKCCPNSRIFT